MRLIPRTGARLATALLVPIALGGCDRGGNNPFGPGGRAIVRVESGLGDTVHQRSVAVSVTVLGVDSSVTLEAVIDPGTAAEQRADVLNRCANYYYLSSPPCAADSTGWTIEVPNELANGPHHLVMRFAAGASERSYTTDFVTDVPTASYTLTALPAAGGTDSDALDVNAAGQIVGWTKDAAGAARATTWRNGTLMVLPTSVTAQSSLAAAVNDAGEMVGGVVDTAGVDVCERGIRWSGGTWRYVLVPDRSIQYAQGTTIYCHQRVLDINAGGTMLIGAPTAPSYNLTRSWIDRNGVQTPMQDVHPVAVNDRDEIVGISEGSSHVPHFYSPNLPVIVPSVRVPNNVGHPFGILLDINNLSQILGTYAGTLFMAATPGRVATDLNPIFTTKAALVGVTDNGTVLAFDGGLKTAFLWRDGRTTRVSVATAGWQLDRVAAMNDAGDIVGHATETATGRTTAVVLRRAP
jgi:probable HAF family extracellular repeat protein